MADITTADGRVRQTDLRIEVGTVQIDLTPVVVDDLARVLHTVLENSERRRVGDLRLFEYLE